MGMSVPDPSDGKGTAMFVLHSCLGLRQDSPICKTPAATACVKECSPCAADDSAKSASGTSCSTCTKCILYLPCIPTKAAEKKPAEERAVELVDHTYKQAQVEVNRDIGPA